MAAAVNGLSPVIITVFIPIFRNWVKRSLIPPFTMSFRCIMPSTLLSLATIRGVAPCCDNSSDFCFISSGKNPLLLKTKERIASTEPFLIFCILPSTVISTPLIRVCAVKGINSASIPARSRPRILNFSLAKTTIERPSGVSSLREDSCATLAISFKLTPSAGIKLVAIRFPKVIVPVLSNSKTSTSPAASIARPLVAITLCFISLSIPLIPIALSNPPIVVGMRQTKRAISTGKLKLFDCGSPDACRL